MEEKNDTYLFRLLLNYFYDHTIDAKFIGDDILVYTDDSLCFHIEGYQLKGDKSDNKS